MPTSRCGARALSAGVGCAVRIGRPAYRPIASAATTSPAPRSASATAVAVLPDAVGPNRATTGRMRYAVTATGAAQRSVIDVTSSTRTVHS